MAEVALFLVGTSYDIATHAAIAGLLAHQLLAVPAVIYSADLFTRAVRCRELQG